MFLSVILFSLIIAVDKNLTFKFEKGRICDMKWVKNFESKICHVPLLHGHPRKEPESIFVAGQNKNSLFANGSF